MAIQEEFPVAARPTASGEEPSSGPVEPVPVAPPPSRPRKRRPQARLRAPEETTTAASDWASLFSDLARRPPGTPEAGAPIEWRVHDRTHLEFAIDYPFQARPVSHSWEAYFFLPESFRLYDATYDKKAIYDDLWSYVRYAVPQVPFHRLASMGVGAPLPRVVEALRGAAGAADGSPASVLAMRRLRLYACLVRASGLSAMREVERDLTAVDGPTRGAGPFIATCSAVASALREVFASSSELALPEEVQVASRWTDEDVSLVLETLCATLGVSLQRTGDAAATRSAEQLAAHAVKEARHRRSAGYASVGSADATEREVEHLEFRRHILKRFTASVLWLSLEVRRATAGVAHALYAVAAAFAMAFALAATFGRSGSAGPDSVYRYALLGVLAYAVKDRLKAFLQDVFTGWIERRFPDRRWSIRDRERDLSVGKVHERAGFRPFRSLPPEVLARRRMTREHALEEHARPERVLWHQKTISVSAAAGGEAAADFPMMTEIFRLNLRRWLAHADDPNRKIAFADPEDAGVYSATARRVYNINVVYRLKSGDAPAPWHRVRVVVSRKGIERIEPIC